MRPRTLDEYIGQDHIIGPGRLLRRAIQADQLTSVIFSGPPGTGKTTLARVIANHTKSNFVTLNAVLAGVQQIRDAIKTAEEQRTLYARKTILFVDEVHRGTEPSKTPSFPGWKTEPSSLSARRPKTPFSRLIRPS
jgi:putative ATPase